MARLYLLSVSGRVTLRVASVYHRINANYQHRTIGKTINIINVFSETNFSENEGCGSDNNNKGRLQVLKRVHQ